MIARPAVWLLVAATVLSAVSLFFQAIVGARRLITETFLGYLPILLGCISMWLCWRAHQKARRKTLVLCYSILLAPFAFSYPAWIAFLYVWYRSGGGGPFP